MVSKNAIKHGLDAEKHVVIGEKLEEPKTFPGHSKSLQVSVNK